MSSLDMSDRRILDKLDFGIIQPIRVLQMGSHSLVISRKYLLLLILFVQPKKAKTLYGGCFDRLAYLLHWYYVDLWFSLRSLGTYEVCWVFFFWCIFWGPLTMAPVVHLLLLVLQGPGGLHKIDKCYTFGLKYIFKIQLNVLKDKTRPWDSSFFTLFTLPF